MNGEILNLSKALAGVLKEKKYTLATAESCTGGLLAGAITAIAGSSTYFDRGFIAYSNDAKIETLGVKSETLVTF